MVKAISGVVDEYTVGSSDDGVDDSIPLEVENTECKTDKPLISCPKGEEKDTEAFGGHEE